MKTDLLVIKDELKKYAKTISKLFAMDVGICDKNLVRSKDKNLEAFYLATPDGRFEALNNKGEYIFIRNSVPGLSSVCIPYHD